MLCYKKDGHWIKVLVVVVDCINSKKRWYYTKKRNWVYTFAHTILARGFDTSEFGRGALFLKNPRNGCAISRSSLSLKIVLSVQNQNGTEAVKTCYAYPNYSLKQQIMRSFCFISCSPINGGGKFVKVHLSSISGSGVSQSIGYVYRFESQYFQEVGLLLLSFTFSLSLSLSSITTSSLIAVHRFICVCVCVRGCLILSHEQISWPGPVPPLRPRTCGCCHSVARGRLVFRESVDRHSSRISVGCFGGSPVS